MDKKERKLLRKLKHTDMSDWSKYVNKNNEYSDDFIISILSYGWLCSINLKLFKISEEQLVRILSNRYLSFKFDDMTFLLKTCSEDVCWRILGKNPFYIQYIKNQTDKMKNTVVKLNPYVIQFISNPSNELIKTAIEENPHVVEVISPSLLSKELKIFAIEHNPDIIRYFIPNDNEIKIAKILGKDFDIVKEYKELCKIAVQKDGSCIRYIDMSYF